MSIFSAFFSGISGLNANGMAMQVIGNNISNINTIGFKGGRPVFADLLSQNLANAGISGQVGLGSRITAIDTTFGQGTFQNSNSSTHVAVSGAGFFVLEHPDLGTGYSRAGNFMFDKNGYLVNPAGYRTQGWLTTPGDLVVDTTTAITDIRIPSGRVDPPSETTIIEIIANLNADAFPDDPAAIGLANGTEVFRTSFVAFDSLGSQHTFTLHAQPVDTTADGALDQWEWAVTVDGSEVTGGTGGTPWILAGSAGFEDDTDGDTVTEFGNVAALGAGPAITFDANGVLLTPAADVAIAIPAVGNGSWANGSNGQTISWNLFNDDLSANVTGFASPSTIISASQNGYGAGQLVGLSIDDLGVMVGVFTNGQTRELAKLALATFNSPEGLVKTGGNIFAEGPGSGSAAIGEPQTGGRGSIAGQTLELSNIDIAEEFTSMIVTERAYQANSRIITTTDEMIQEALTLKR